ncbi:MAG: hypothetical protein EHM85_20055 [Desulfobacteraceae bacterium]|nr:MAG: hypothetical protein EHM85_20055 [Desulfobacteraceae bacterium]
MKKIALLLVAMTIAFVTYSQSNKEEVDLLQAAFGMDKKAVVASFVQPTDLQKDAFWNLYDEYELQRKENGKKRIQLLEQYAKQYNSMTEEQADSWTTEVMKLQTATDKLISSYYKKIRKVSSPIVATQFYQIENYILTGIRMEILEGVPFLERKK